MPIKKEKTKLGAPVKRTPKAKSAKSLGFGGILKIGDKGPVVEYAAKCLAKKGSSIKPTKMFHIGMQAAVFSFQRKNGLPQTGKIDKKTWMKLTAK